MIRRSRHQRCSIKKGVVRNFVKFTRKHLCQSLFNFIRKETLVQVFSCEICEIFKNTFFTEHLRATSSGLVKPCLNSDLYLISKSSGTALLETIVSYKPLPILSHRKTEKLLPQHFQINQQQKSLNVYLFLDFELQLRKSKEFNNNQIKVLFKRALKSFFLSPKK